jgi:hypothetical protein
MERSGRRQGEITGLSAAADKTWGTDFYRGGVEMKSRKGV